jgi:hypothetical protein
MRDRDSRHPAVRDAETAQVAATANQDSVRAANVTAVLIKRRRTMLTERCRERSACPNFTSTTCVIPATRWRPAQGASLKELMERMGHSSPPAALIYLHATRDRDKKIAAGMGKLFKDTTKKGSGMQRARRRK